MRRSIEAARYEALRRRRADTSDADQLTRIINTTIGGVAAGLQTAG